MTTKRFLGPGLVIVLFGTLLVQLPLAIADRASAYEWFDPIIEVRRILVDRFVEEPDEADMQRAMIDGMIDVLRDPYTQYIPPADLADFDKQLRGVYAGIGAEVNIANDQLVIVSPMDNSPALRAGVQAGDVVLEIEGESTFQLSIDECIERLTGEIGTPVRIRVRHPDGTEADIEIIRDQIVTLTVRGLRRDGEAWNFCVDPTHRISYIRVTQFNAATVDELRTVVTQQLAEGLGGLVLDLRDNPGGGLPAAVGMADLFLSDGTILSVRPRVGDAITYEATENGTLPAFPMMVLINEASASASEIVAGALQENGRAKVLGERSYGKGSVQEVRRLAYSAGTLKYTAAHYYLPSGRNINRSATGVTWGVDPDPGYVVPFNDEAFLENIQARRPYEIIQPAPADFPECVDATWIAGEIKDAQLAAAVSTLVAHIDGGGWTPVNDLDPGLEATAQELTRAREARTRMLTQLRRLDERIDTLDGDAVQGDPLPEKLDLTDGRITLTDRNGVEIGRFRVRKGNVREALSALDLVPVDTE